MAKEPPLKVKPFYTYTELGKLMDISRRRVERVCKTHNIATERIGIKHVIMVSELQAKFPSLWDSLVAVERAKAFHRYLQELPRPGDSQSPVKTATVKPKDP